MTQLRNKHVLITGGAQGIGALLAEGCLVRGAARVTLWDVNADALDARVRALQALGFAIEGRVVDMAESAQIIHAAGALSAEFPVDVLMNNAGIVVGKPLAEQRHDEIEKTLRVNTLGVIHATRAFLPAMIARGGGHIVNIASASGFVPVPRLSTYGASKWACLGFSESLRVELHEHKGIHVTTVCPSYIKTGMFAGASAPLLTPLLEPEYAARRILRAIERDTAMLCMPRIVHLVPMLYALLPAPLFDAVCGRFFGIYRSMDHFQGKDTAPRD
jgi:short-subunit dehydrogenase